MLKRTTKHQIYEVWNEYAAESVFVDHKPLKAEIEELVTHNKWLPAGFDMKEFIKQHIVVERLWHFYTNAN